MCERKKEPPYLIPCLHITTEEAQGERMLFLAGSWSVFVLASFL